MTSRRVLKQFNQAVNETLSIQRDVSAWLTQIKDPRNPSIHLSAHLLLSRCHTNMDSLQSIQGKTDDHIMLTTISQHLIMLKQTMEQIKQIQQFVHSSNQSIEVSNTAIEIATLEHFKQQLTTHLHGKGIKTDEKE